MQLAARGQLPSRYRRIDSENLLAIFLITRSADLRPIVRAAFGDIRDENYQNLLDAVRSGPSKDRFWRAPEFRQWSWV
jgi:hypothetical protein